ncbi:unnamed protein product [marine sediment metagenome]|uniref:Uncharacterized protein n=1 Tax=marine sediment metagenome TaxID=412755 RepID=X1BR31_9ZZZZ
MQLPVDNDPFIDASDDESDASKPTCYNAKTYPVAGGDPPKFSP